MAWYILLMIKVHIEFCVLFGKFSDNRINALGVLIEQPLTNWKKATEKLKAHFSTAKYHMHGSNGIS